MGPGNNFLYNNVDFFHGCGKHLVLKHITGTDSIVGSVLIHKPLSHRDSGKYTGNVLRHLFPDRQICCIHTASDFPESVRAFTHNP